MRHHSETLGAWSPRVAAVAIALAAVGLARCGATPASSSVTSPSPVTAALTVSGNLVFTAPGQMSQLSAVAGDGSPVVGSVSWTSALPGVVAVSPTGLATAIAFGTASIRATAPGASGIGVAIVTAVPSSSVKTLSTCQTILAAGSYVVGADVSSAGTLACIQVSSTALVQLDCQGHTIAGLSISSSHGVTISNCIVSGGTTVVSSDTTVASNMTLNGGLTVTNASAVTLAQSTVHPATGERLSVVTVAHGTNVQLTQDVVSGAASPIAGAAVRFTDGTGNQVRQCTIDGAYDGGPQELGVDDGVLLINEAGDTVQGNTIRNFWDTAAEGVDLVSNTTIADNIVSNVGATAFGSYWCTTWTGNVIRNNDVSQAPTLVLIYYGQGLGQCGPTSLPAAFTGNQIVGNRFRTPALGTQPFLPSLTTAVPTLGPASRLIVKFFFGPVSGNLIQGNDLGTNDGPLLIPLQGFTDGGGNVCGPFNPALSTLACGGP